MRLSKDLYTNWVLDIIGNEVIEELNNYTNEVLNRSFISFKNIEEIKTFFKDNLRDLNSKLTYNDIDNIRAYTGIAFKDINAILRGTWNYEVNGLYTENKVMARKKIAEGVSLAIDKTLPINDNIIVYRGVNNKAFKKFGINSIDDIKTLKGQFIYDRGFTSTSLLRESSFFNRDLEWHDNCNVEIQYFIPKEHHDAIPLMTDDFSYAVAQSEYLIDSGSLSKVIDVKINPNNKTAYLQMVYIPKDVWDKSRKQEQSHSMKR